ncbi:MAG: hypothetical protein NUV72_10720 [Bauldia sp.]|nr:hypothetical protein [Bauldia sp.]
MQFAENCRQDRDGPGGCSGRCGRAIGVYDSAKGAASINSGRDFADFNTEMAPILAGSPERVELDLLRSFSR